MIAIDKRKHIAAGAAGALGFQIASAVLMHAPLPGAGTAVAYALGWGKEAWDAWQNRKALAAGLPPPHSVEVADRNATAAGGMVIDLISLAAIVAGFTPI